MKIETRFCKRKFYICVSEETYPLTHTVKTCCFKEKKDDSFALYRIIPAFVDDGGKCIRDYNGKIEDRPEKMTVKTPGFYRKIRSERDVNN